MKEEEEEKKRESRSKAEYNGKKEGKKVEWMKREQKIDVGGIHGDGRKEEEGKVVSQGAMEYH